MKQRLIDYMELTRANKPIGTLLLLWPTLWACWLGASAQPDWGMVVVFVLGVFFMRSAGCVINDFADRHVDGHVARTQHRPLPSGRVSTKEALILFSLLVMVSFGLVLLTNLQTILLSFVGVFLAALYPFMKRYTHLPQVFLGLAFSWSIPMAYSAQGGDIWAPDLWLLFIANLFWTIAYDTYYAMVDRDDDLKIGIKSTAILFGRYDLSMIIILQALMLCLLIVVGHLNTLHWPYYFALMVSCGWFILQFRQAKDRQAPSCFQSFLDNNRVGYTVFLGIVLSDLWII